MNNIKEYRTTALRAPAVNVKLVVSIAVLSLMVLIRDLGYFYFAPIYYITVVSIICIFLPLQELRSFFFFYSIVGFSIHGIALIPILVALILKNKKLHVVQFVFTVLILLFELIHFSSYSFNTDFNKYFVYSLYIALFFLVLFDDNYNNSSIKDGMKYYIIGTVVASLIIIIHSIANFGFQNIVYENIRIGTSFEDYDADNEMIMTLNPNQLAYYSMTAFSLLLFVKDLFSNKYFKAVLMFVLVFAGVLSGSRTWIIIMAAVLFIYFSFSGMKGKYAFLLIIAVLLLAALRYNSYTEAIYSRYESRFEESNIRTAGHRTEIFKEYNQWLKEHPNRMVYGAGALYYNNICKIGLSTHNSTQQIIVCYGVIGLVLFLLCILVYHKRYSKPNHARFWYYMPFLVCLFFSQAGQFLSPACMMFPFVATALPLKLTLEG